MAFPSYIVELLLGYLIGSLPTAYLLVKWKAHRDITNEGSHNVGAMNAFEVTNSKGIGVLCMVSDMLKGTSAVIAGYLIFPDDTQTALALCGIGSVIGHNYPVWLKFKGGRGLSTTAGVMFVLCWAFVAVWVVLWAVLFKIFKDIHKANILASVVSPAGLLVLPDTIIKATSFRSLTADTVFYTAIITCALILARHEEPIRTILRSYFQSTK